MAALRRWLKGIAWFLHPSPPTPLPETGARGAKPARLVFTLAPLRGEGRRASRRGEGKTLTRLSALGADREDSLQHRILIFSDFTVPKPEHENAVCCQVCVSLPVYVLSLGCGMGVAVSFDDQLGPRAIRIKNVWAVRMLAAELETDKSAVTEETP